MWQFLTNNSLFVAKCNFEECVTMIHYNSNGRNLYQGHRKQNIEENKPKNMKLKYLYVHKLLTSSGSSTLILRPGRGVVELAIELLSISKTVMLYKDC